MNDKETSVDAFGLAAFLLSAASMSRSVARGDIDRSEISKIVAIAREYSKLGDFPGDPAVAAYAEKLLSAVERIVGRPGQSTPARH